MFIHQGVHGDFMDSSGYDRLGDFMKTCPHQQNKNVDMLDLEMVVNDV